MNNHPDKRENSCALLSRNLKRKLYSTMEEHKADESPEREASESLLPKHFSSNPRALLAPGYRESKRLERADYDSVGSCKATALQEKELLPPQKKMMEAASKWQERFYNVNQKPIFPGSFLKTVSFKYASV